MAFASLPERPAVGLVTGGCEPHGGHFACGDEYPAGHGLQYDRRDSGGHWTLHLNVRCRAFDVRRAHFRKLAGSMRSSSATTTLLIEPANSPGQKAPASC